ncbi:protein kinase domain-containing protein, partial [Trichormus variabilis]
MAVLICDTKNELITLLGEPIQSGEAQVWHTDRQGYLAKIYHLPTSERLEKLKVMISSPPQEPNSHLNHISFAWPQSLLKTTQGEYVGFLMPEIKGAKELIDLYNPQRRKKLKLEIDWRFLHTTALNIASIIEAIHSFGYVLGDIKPQNILVNNRALPSIIDTDSFQVRHLNNSKVYRCLVGSPGFTPPELIGKDFSLIDQTELHDRFRVAVIIYHLLFGGESPFGGKWIGTGDLPEVNELIRQGFWLYGVNSLIQSTNRTIDFNIIHPEVQRCFLKCFNEGYQNPNLRPTAKEWVKALRLALDDLTVCSKADSHYYSRIYGQCYWCERTNNLGIDIFPSTSKSQKLIEKKEKNSLIGHSNWVSSVTFSSDGNMVISGSYDTTIKIWNLTTEKQICTLTGHTDSVLSIAISPNDKIIASGSSDKTIKLWNLVTMQQICTLIGHTKGISSVTFSLNRNILASGSYDTTIKLWNLTTKEEICTLIGHAQGISSIAFSPDGNILASGSYDTTIKLWNLTTGEQINTLIGHSHFVLSVAFSPDGKTLVSGCYDATIKLWDLVTGKQTRTITGHGDSVTSVIISPDGETFASGSFDETVILWDLVTAKEIHRFYKHYNNVNSVAFSTNSKIIASGSDDNTIQIFHLSSQKFNNKISINKNTSKNNLITLYY